MLKRDYDKITFHGVGLAFIITGAVITAFAAVGWLVNINAEVQVISMPFEKLIGGLLITGLGYIILELELLRKR